MNCRVLKFFILIFVSPSGVVCSFAEDLSAKVELSNNVDYYIFNDAERRFLSNHPPLYKFSSLEPKGEVSNQPEVELTLREIELKRFESETDEEFIERGNVLHSELLERPENFHERARTLSASRSRFRAGLLTPLTANQLDSEVREEVMKLDSFQLSRPIKIGDSIFLIRREGARTSVKGMLESN